MAYLVQYANGVPAVKHEISQVSLTIGEGIENDVCLPEDGVSAFHAILVAVLEDQTARYSYFIKPADEKLSVQINDKRVAGLVQLHENDLLQIGEVSLRFINENECLIKTPDNVIYRDIKPVEETHIGIDEEESYAVDDSVANSRFSRRLKIF